MPQLSISHMPYLDLPLAEELRIGPELGPDVQQGLYLDKVAETGWASAAKIVRQASATVSYVATATTVAADDPAGWSQHRQTLLRGLDWCAEVGVPTLYFTSGPSGGYSPDVAAHAFHEHVSPVVTHAAEVGVGVALENTVWGRAGISFTHSIRETAEVAATAGLGIVADLFCAWQEHHLADTLQAHRDRIAIIQLSDFSLTSLPDPVRRVPGDGDIPFDWQIDLIRKLQWTGLLDLELFGPAIDKEGRDAAVRRGLAWLRVQQWSASA